jgi:hypothetical protein
LHEKSIACDASSEVLREEQNVYGFTP